MLISLPETVSGHFNELNLRFGGENLDNLSTLYRFRKKSIEITTKLVMIVIEIEMKLKSEPINLARPVSPKINQ